MLEVMNSIEEDLNFTSETQEDFEGQTLRTLDTQIWVEYREVESREERPETRREQDTSREEEETEHRRQDEGHEKQVLPGSSSRGSYPVILYKFYKKPTSSRLAIMENSSSSWESKKTSLSQEYSRRLMCTSEEIPLADRLKTT